MRFLSPPPPLRLFVPTVPNKRTYSQRILDNLPKEVLGGIDWALSIELGVHSGPRFACKI